MRPRPRARASPGSAPGRTFEKSAALGLLILFAVVTVAALQKMDFAMANGSGASIGMFVLLTTIAGSFNLARALSPSTTYRQASPTPAGRWPM